MEYIGRKIWSEVIDVSEQKRAILAIYLLVLVGMCLYVPWEAGAPNAIVRIPAGYAFIWDPPIYFQFYPDAAKAIGPAATGPRTDPNASALDRLAAGLSAKPTQLPISGVDIKRLAVEIIALTALAGLVYMLIERQGKDDEV